MCHLARVEIRGINLQVISITIISFFMSMGWNKYFHFVEQKYCFLYVALIPLSTDVVGSHNQLFQSEGIINSFDYVLIKKSCFDYVSCDLGFKGILKKKKFSKSCWICKRQKQYMSSFLILYMVQISLLIMRKFSNNLFYTHFLILIGNLLVHWA